MMEARLTPYDSELFIMVESLTGKKCVPKRGDGGFFFEVDYSCNRDPEFILAIYDAVSGRLGDRLIKINDDPDASRFIVFAKYSDENYPELVGKEAISRPNINVGNLFILRFGSGRKRAVNVTRQNLLRLLEFVGNGQMEIERRPGGKAVFHFVNGGSVFQTAPEYSYIVHVRDDLFEVIDGEKFENEWTRLF